jgi:pyruvate/2-oxoglutarate dehydrogenase complex dihydrolipoamide acyltransferase (E2) component
MSPAASAKRTAPATPVLVPREIVNADTVFVVSWAVDDGASVQKGAPLCDIETSKAVVTVEAEADGYLRRRAAEGDEVPIGGVLGYITTTADAPLPETEAGAPRAEQGAGEVRFSAKARKKVEELGLDASLFAGRGLVREQDVLAVAAEAKEQAQAQAAEREDPRGPFRLENLGPIQRRVARVMEQSVAAIPAASLDRCIDLAAVRARAQAVAGEGKSVVTEVDLLVAAVAAACRESPRFNCFVTPEDRLHVFEQVNVGVAVDVKGDLYVIVVRQADAKPAAAIAKELRGLQYLAARQRLTPEQVSGGTITVTSMIGRGVHRFVPIPYPQQAAIVGIADPQPASSQAVLTLVFDHRVANGSQAAAFLAAIDAALHGETA